MKSTCIFLVMLTVIINCHYTVTAQLQRPDTNFKIYQFPPDKIPNIDGKIEDWSIVPDSYAIGTDQLIEDSG